MAEEQVDALVLEARFDIAGLIRSSDLVLAEVQRVSNAVNQASGVGGRGLPVLDVDEITKTANGTRNLGNEARKLGPAFDVGRQGGRLLERSLTSMVVAGAGVTGTLGRILEGLVLFAGANLPLLELAATVGAVVAAYELLTKSQHDAAAAREKLVKALDTRVQAARPETTQVASELVAATEERALKEKEVANIQKDEAQNARLILQILGANLLDLGDEIRLRKLNRDIVKETRDIRAGEAQLTSLIVNAAVAETVALLDAMRGISKEIEAGKAAAIKARGEIQALGQQTFTNLPGRTGVVAPQAVISDQELANFRDRVALAKEATGADLADLRAKRDATEQETAIGPVALRQLDERIKLLNLAIKARQLEGDETVRQILREERLLEAQRRAALAQQSHLERVARAGGGNLLGATPLGLQAQQEALTLPTAADVQRLALELLKIPPIGLPTAVELDAAWAQARKAALPTILQGAIQQGVVSGEGKAIQRSREDAKQLAEAMREVRLDVADSAVAALGLDTNLGHAVTGAVSLAGALGSLSQANADIKNASDSTESLAANLAKVQAIGGLISIGLGILGSALGPDAGNEEQKRLTKENSDRLRELTGALERTALGVGGTADIGKTAAALAAAGIEGTVRARQFGFGDIGGGQAILDKAARDAGSSLAELQAIAKENGITLLDKDGKLVAGSLEALAKATDLAAEAATHFSTTFSARQQQLEIADKLGIGGRSSDAQVAALQRDREAQLASLHLSDAEEARIRALDLSTAEGRAKFLAFEQDLFRRAAAGQLSPAELGAFQNVDELGQALGQGADDMKAFNATVNDATKSLSNFPDTFKLAQAEFAARAVDVGGTPLPAPSHPSPTDFHPGLRGTAPGSPTTNVTGNTIVFQINTQPGMSAGDIARIAVDEMETRGIANFGLAPPP